MPSWLRLIVLLLLGNLLGFVAWQFALWAIPHLWQGVVVADAIGGELMVRVALTFMLLGTPPVLIGALCGGLARRAQSVVGLACGLWSLSLIQATPPELHIAMPVWYAPTVLVFLSGTMGGWLMELRANAVLPPPANGAGG